MAHRLAGILGASRICHQAAAHMHCLESDQWRLWLEPHRGVQWMAAEIQREQTWHAVVPDCRALNGVQRSGQPPMDDPKSVPLPAANFHMLPYSNRIRDGRFHFHGETIQLDEAARHAIHGTVRKLPWTVQQADRSSIECGFISEEHASVNWPWPFSASIRYALDGPELQSTITLVNAGDRPMPAGMGWHPYFVRELAGASPALQLPVTGVFPDSSGDCLPDGAPQALPDVLDFTTQRALPAGQRIDCCLSGLSGTCLLSWPDAGVELSMSASEHCRFLVLFNPDMPHFAVEPVSNANDGFNLDSQGIDAGVQVLAPGESWSVQMQLRVRTF